MRKGKWERKIRQMDEIAAREEAQQLQALDEKKKKHPIRNFFIILVSI